MGCCRSKKKDPAPQKTGRRGVGGGGAPPESPTHIAPEVAGQGSREMKPVGESGSFSKGVETFAPAPSARSSRIPLPFDASADSSRVILPGSTVHAEPIGSSFRASRTPMAPFLSGGPQGVPLFGGRLVIASSLTEVWFPTAAGPEETLEDSSGDPEDRACCVSRPQLNVGATYFKCRDTLHGYLERSRDEENRKRKKGIELPPPDDFEPYTKEFLDAEKPGGIIEINGREHFFYEAFCPVTLVGGHPCDCEVSQKFRIEDANLTLLNDIRLFLEDRHETYREVNAGLNLPGSSIRGPPHSTGPLDIPPPPEVVDPREGGEYNDYVQSWWDCCTGADVHGTHQAYLSLVDAPGGFRPAAKGSLLFSIHFLGQRLGYGAPCRCKQWTLKFRLCIQPGTTKARLSWCMIAGYPRCTDPGNEGATVGSVPDAPIDQNAPRLSSPSTGERLEPCKCPKDEKL